MCVYTELNAGLVGLSLTYAISLADMLQYTIRLSAEVENTVGLLKKLDSRQPGMSAYSGTYIVHVYIDIWLSMQAWLN